MDRHQGRLLFAASRTRQEDEQAQPTDSTIQTIVHLRSWEQNGARYPIQRGAKSVSEVNRSFRQLAEDIGLGDVMPHGLRHTIVTWMMQEGIDLWKAVVIWE
jgi:integrase